MKGRIDENGCLYLKKTRGWVAQKCPFAAFAFYETNSGVPIPSTRRKNCGDWCPLFGEIIYGQVQATLTICQNKTLLMSTATIKRT